MVLFNGRNVVQGLFPNNEKRYLDCDDLVKKKNFIDLIFESNEDLFDLAMIKYWFDDNAMKTTTVLLRINFIPYAQMDRKIGKDLFSFKYLAKFINSLNFDTVRISDPHSPVVAAAIDRCIINYPMFDVDLENYDLIFYPDNGAAKKYSEIYEKSYRFGNKKRNLETGEIECYEIIANKKDIEGKKILMRDDLIIGGGTYKYAAKALRDMGAKEVDLYITHIMPSAEDFCKNYKEYGIDNFYSDNTLNVPFYTTPRVRKYTKINKEELWEQLQY